MTLTNTFRTTITVATFAAASAAFIGSQTASAGFVPPPVHFSITVTGDTVNFNNAYQAAVFAEIGDGQFAYQIDTEIDPDFHFNPTTLTIANGQPTSLPAGIFTGFAFQNNSNETLQVVITYLMETNFAAPGTAPWDTNVSIGVNANTTINTLKNSPFWHATIDGGSIAQLFPHKSMLQGIDGAASADMSADGVDATPLSTMGITITFDINPGGQVFFNGNFSMIPAPGSIALLAIGGLVAVGRRRRQTVA